MNLSKGKTENKEVECIMMTRWANLTSLTKTFTSDLLVREESIKLMKGPSRAGIRTLRKEREELDNKC